MQRITDIAALQKRATALEGRTTAVEAKNDAQGTARGALDTRAATLEANMADLWRIYNESEIPPAINYYNALTDGVCHGDGVTDDTNHILAAIGEYKRLGKTGLYFPAASYYLGSTLAVPANTVLLGAGEATTHLLGTVTYGSGGTYSGYTVVPYGAIFDVMDYGAVGNGTTNDSAAIQSAINDCVATGGGTVNFPAHTYRITSRILLPQGNTHPVLLYGGAQTAPPYGATIKVDGPYGFLTFQQTVDNQSHRYYTVQGFNIDATLRSGNVGCSIIGGSARDGSLSSYAGGGLYSWRCDTRDITLKNLYCYGAPGHKNVNANCWGISIGTKHGVENDPVCNYINNITVDNVRIEGGDTGMLIAGQLGGSATSQHALPYYMNCELDNITVNNFYYDSGKVPPYPSRIGNTGLMINQHARGGSATVSNCFCKGTEDDLYEYNTMDSVVTTNCDAQETYDLGYQLRNQGGATLHGNPAATYEHFTYINCTYEALRSTIIDPQYGFGFGSAETGHMSASNITYTNCHYTTHDGVVHTK